MKIVFFLSVLLLSSCGGFKASRVDSETSDDKALSITDNWVVRDTENAIADIMTQIKSHRGLQNYIARKGLKQPALFIAEIQNETSEAYFPISDLNDEFLNELSIAGQFILIDEAARNRLLEEVTYHNDGMVDPETAKNIGRQTGADLLVFGNVLMTPESRGGKTLKQYRVNIRMTDLERGVEVFRGRTQVHKYSQQKKFGW